MATPERWKQVERLLDQALELAPSERSAFLDRGCSGDPALRAQVERLLVAAESPGSFLGRPAREYAAPVVASVAASELLSPGTRLGAYDIVRELGRGGMATVYLARDLRHHRVVAVKVLLPELAAAVGPERFLREIEIAASLTHPHVLPLYDSGNAGGLLYYVMPYVEGESLRACLEREGQLPLDQALRIAQQVLAALAYAHSRGIVHRDIKPENILLEGDQAVVADFGIARAVSEAGGKRLTETGVAVGTPAYMSPEQASGRTDPDPRSDLYSLGCVIYETLAGEPPFTGPSAQAVIARHCAEPPRPLRVVRPDLPVAVQSVLETALAKAPAGRYASATEFARALAAAASGAPPTPRLASFRSRSRLGIAAVLALTLLGAGALVLSRASQPALDPKRVAVAVFNNRTGDPALDQLGGMAADWITRGLMQTGLVDVVDVGVIYLQGRGASKEPTDPLDLARQNGAGTVVAGSFYRSGGDVVFQAALTDARAGRILRSLEPARGPLDEPERGVEALRQRVMAGLAAQLDARVSAFTAATSDPPTFAAYQEFAAGQDAIYRLRPGEASLHFRRAVALDPGFLTAAVRLAVAAEDSDQCEVTDSVHRALAARGARLTSFDRITLDYHLAECRGDYEESYRLNRERAAANPWSTYAQWRLAGAAVVVNRPREAVQLLERLDPARDFGWLPDAGKFHYWINLVWAYHELGDYQAELVAARRFREVEPNRLATVTLEVAALAALGRDQELLARLDQAAALPAEFTGRFRLTPGFLCLKAAGELLMYGHPASARVAAERAVTRLRSRPSGDPDAEIDRFDLASALMFLGRYGEALPILKALAAADTASIRYRGALGVLAALRGDRDEAASVDQELASLTRPYLRGQHTHWRARIAAALGDRERAVGLLRDAIGQGARGPWYHADPLFASLRGYASFEELRRPRG